MRALHLPEVGGAVVLESPSWSGETIAKVLGLDGDPLVGILSLHQFPWPAATQAPSGRCYISFHRDAFNPDSMVPHGRPMLVFGLGDLGIPVGLSRMDLMWLSGIIGIEQALRELPAAVRKEIAP